MKHSWLFLFPLFMVSLVNAQVTNTRQGLWSDATAWSNNSVPGSSDDVVLNYDIIIDADAYCRSLNLNGHNASVSSGIHLYITGTNDNADTLLSRYVVIDTSVSPADTFKTIDFYYDSLKRNVLLTSVQYSSSGVVEYTFTDSFFYNGSNRKPYKASGYSVYYSQGQPYYSSGTSFFTFQNDRLVYDSSGDYVDHYTYLPGSIISQTEDHSVGSISTDTSYVEYDNNGNILRQVDTTTFDGPRNFYYEFDNHPNPFRSTQLNCGRVLNLIETFIEESFANNNMLYVNQYQGFSNHYESLYGYGYKPNGYPKEVWGYDPANPSVPGQGKALFIYTR